MTDTTPLSPRYEDENYPARYLNVAKKTLQAWRASGLGPPFYKFGQVVRYEVNNELPQWAEQQKHASTASVSEETK